MNRLIRKLVLKELYVNRWFITGGAVSAVVSVMMALTGRTGFNIASIAWLTTIIASGVMLVIYGSVYERKHHTLQFVLSLPLSTTDYVRAKAWGLTACFLPIWLAGSAAALTLVFGHPGVPDGLGPFLVLLCVFMLANFTVLLCGALHVRSEALSTAAILVTNMAASVFMFTVAPLPGIGKYMWAATPAWNSTFWTVLGCELGVLVIAFSLPFFFAARRRDFL